MVEPADDIEERSFPGAGGAKDTSKLLLRKIQANRIKRFLGQAASMIDFSDAS